MCVFVWTAIHSNYDLERWNVYKFQLGATVYVLFALMFSFSMAVYYLLFANDTHTTNGISIGKKEKELTIIWINNNLIQLH